MVSVTQEPAIPIKQAQLQAKIESLERQAFTDMVQQKDMTTVELAISPVIISTDRNYCLSP